MNSIRRKLYRKTLKGFLIVGAVLFLFPWALGLICKIIDLAIDAYARYFIFVFHTLKGFFQ